MTTHHPNLKISPDVPLKPHTTFKIGGPARYFISVAAPDQARDALAFARKQAVPVLVLGGGSNVLVSDRGFDGLVVHPVSEGIEELATDNGYVRLRILAGEPWDRAVAHTVDCNLWGIENLSHIPGQSGAALVQNIGAYGQQLSDTFESVEVLEVASGRSQTLTAGECGLGYRRSIFNSARKNEFIILAIHLRLRREPRPNLGYKDVASYFEQAAIRTPSQAQIRAAIIAIRDSKFPFPREERGGNAGSFFKNPTLPASEYRDLERQMESRFGAAALTSLRDRVGRAQSNERVRVPGAFLMSICGLKGLERGRAQVNPTQPLVILNLGGATAEDVMELAKQVRATVYRETGIRLDPEPELIGFSTGELDHYLRLD